MIEIVVMMMITAIAMVRGTGDKTPLCDAAQSGSVGEHRIREESFRVKAKLDAENNRKERRRIKEIWAKRKAVEKLLAPTEAGFQAVKEHRLRNDRMAQKLTKIYGWSIPGYFPMLGWTWEWFLEWSCPEYNGPIGIDRYQPIPTDEWVKTVRDRDVAIRAFINTHIGQEVFDCLSQREFDDAKESWKPRRMRMRR